MIRSENVAIPLVIGGILILGSFAPIIQIVMLQGNGSLMFFIDLLTENIDESILNYINLYLGLLCILPFYYSKTLGYKILWAILSTWFLHGFIVFLEMEYTHGGDTEPYFLGFIISAILSVLPLLVTAIIKERKAAST